MWVGMIARGKASNQRLGFRKAYLNLNFRPPYSIRIVMIEVSLWPFEYELFFIIKAPTGVFYTNQSGGHACAHPSCEGYIIPVRVDSMQPIDDCKLLHHVWGGEDGDHASGYRTNALKPLNDFLSNLIREERLQHFKEVKIDESRLDELIEGWWPIKGIIYIPDNEYNFDNLNPFTGYLAKENCD